MRIALDATYSEDPRPTGIAVYSQELLCALPRHEQDNFVYCYRWKQWRRAKRRPPRNVSVRPLLPPLPTFSADIFHALNQRVDRRPAKVVISTFHDLFVMTGDYSSAAFRTRFTGQARQAARQSDLIIAVSEFTAGQVVELLGFDRKRIRVIPHGVRPVAPQRNAPREKIILFVGVLQRRKNVARLVEAFEQLGQNDWRLVLAGSPSGYGSASILETIDASPSRERIEVTGYVTNQELQRLYASASVFAFPSLDEGFGIPVLEAMSYGLPVVTSNRSGLAEIAANAALLVNPEETGDIALALQRLTNDFQLREKLGNAGRSHAEEYSWERTVGQTYQVYRSAVGSLD